MTLYRAATAAAVACALVGGVAESSAFAAHPRTAVEADGEGAPAPSTPTELLEFDSRAAAWTVYNVTNKKTVSSNYTNRAQQLGSCKAARAGTTCTISVTKAATRTVGLALGASRATVTAGLNISKSSTVSMSVSCSSPTLRAGQTYRAWPRGKRYSYQVWKTASNTAGVVTVSKSGTLYAFDPGQNAITCG